MAHIARGWVNYLPSNTVQFATQSAIKADSFTASNNGGALLATPPNYNFWPAHRADLRAVYGIDSTGRYKDLCIALSATGALYTLGAVFGDSGGNTYKVNGLRSEKFRIRNMK